MPELRADFYEALLVYPLEIVLERDCSSTCKQKLLVKKDKKEGNTKVERNRPSFTMQRSFNFWHAFRVRVSSEAEMVGIRLFASSSAIGETKSAASSEKIETSEK